ncbi:unnamed protein product [Calicophoron daubneyi]|uniref:PDZ domain-containing protein n=1 Tax=Calicophoron daubneyi TaxID=300641 RepID=A0AAV2TXR2_CALDB
MNGTEETNANPHTKVLIEVIIPEHQWKFVYRVPSGVLVREFVRYIITSCHMNKMEYINHGLYVSSSEQQNGKFLQEERQLLEYPLLVSSPYHGSDELQPLVSFQESMNNEDHNVPSLKLIPKCRYPEGPLVNQRKFKHANSRTHQKQLLSAIKSQNWSRINQLLDGGLDPNFQLETTGETPLCLAAQQQNANNIILTLVEKGAHLEYRDCASLTPLHCAAVVGNYEAIKALLDLGESPNVRDIRELTPLYHAVSKDIPTKCVTQLLYDHAVLGVMDDKGRQEIHQACLFDHPGHLEQLILYGADLDAQTLKLDTPLHICALNNHEACLRILLRYGATRYLTNSSGQTASEVALLTGLNNIAALIDNFTDDQIRPVTYLPEYNKLRKPSALGPRGALEKIDGTQLPPQSADRLPSFHLEDDHVSSRSSSVPVAGRTPTPEYFTTVTARNHQEGYIGERRSGLQMACTRFVTLKRNSSGFGFQLRGRIRSGRPDESTKRPATQYFYRIYPDTPASQADLKEGDYLLEVNGVDVSEKSHYEVTGLIVRSGPQVNFKVLTGYPLPTNQDPPPYEPRRSGTLEHRCSSSSALEIPADVNVQERRVNPRDSRLNSQTSDRSTRERTNYSLLPGVLNSDQPSRSSRLIYVGERSSQANSSSTVSSDSANREDSVIRGRPRVYKGPNRQPRLIIVRETPQFEVEPRKSEVSHEITVNRRRLLSPIRVMEAPI